MGDRRKSSRRSSILKPPKPRNPLSDVDLNPPSVDATFMKSRRVSFANSNFIKEFTADPEKNTIWHNSYEEVVNKSEDSKNCASRVSDELNCTRADLDSSYETPLVSSPLEMSMCGSNIDLTTNEAPPNSIPVPVLNVNYPVVDNRNVLLPTNQFTTVFDQLPRNMEITGSIPANSNLMKNILKTKQNLHTLNKENEPYFVDELIATGYCNNVSTLDLTQAVSNNIVDNNDKLDMDESMSECSMEITQTISTSITTVDNAMDFTNIQKVEDNMEMTQAIPAGLRYLLNKTELSHIQNDSDSDGMEFTSAIPAGIKLSLGNTSVSKVDKSMEFTSAIPSTIKLPTNNCNSSKLGEMEFTTAIPAGIKLTPNLDVENVNTSMEFTQALPPHLKFLTTNNTTNKNDSKVEDNMEFTQAIPAALSCLNSNKIENNSNTKIDDNNMEFTCAIPTGIKLRSDMNSSETNTSMVFTKAIPSELKCLQIPTITINLSPNADTSMEAVSTDAALTCLNSNKTINNDSNSKLGDMEFTCAIPTGIQITPNVEFKSLNNKSNISMEFTTAIPAGIKLTSNVEEECANKSNSESNISMEFTQAIPAVALNCLNSNKNNSTSKLGDMEFTCAIPTGIQITPNTEDESVNKSNSEINTSMEFTQAIPAAALKYLNSNKNNVSSCNSTLELTEAIPADINTQVAPKQNNTSSNNENSNTSMEFTQAVPTDVNLCPSNSSNKNESQSQDNMEFTSAPSVTIELTPENNDKDETKVIETETNISECVQNNTNTDNANTNESNNEMSLDDSVFTKDENTNMESISKENNPECNETIPTPLKLFNSSSAEKVPLPSILKLMNYSKKMSETVSELELTKVNEQLQESTNNTNTGIEIESNTNELELSNISEPVPEQQIKKDFANIFHLKGYPLILSPRANENDSNKSDICLRIKYANDDDNENKPVNISQLEKDLEMDINKTTKESEFSSSVDCTERLINYQINYNSPQTNESIKRQSTENICNISNIPRKISNNESYDYENNESMCDNNVAWKSMVEKSYIQNDELNSVDVSLVTSFNSSKEEDNKDEQQTNNISISEYLKQILQKLKDAIETEIKVPKILIDQSDEQNQSKCDIFRRRYEESFKQQKHINVDFKELTLDEKIKQKSKDAVWNIVELSPSKYTFNFMFETIVFVVHVAETSENVKKVEFYSEFCEETSHPRAIYVHNILRKKLTRNYIVSALGEPYTVLSLLDLITMTGEQMLDILNEFDELECRYGVVLNHQLKAQIKFFDLHLPLAFEASINITNLEAISGDDVTVTRLVGDIDENAIKKLIQGCPQNIQLLRTFIQNVENHIKFLKSIKRKKH